MHLEEKHQKAEQVKHVTRQTEDVHIVRRETEARLLLQPLEDHKLLYVQLRIRVPWCCLCLCDPTVPELDEIAHGAGSLAATRVASFWISSTKLLVNLLH